MCFATASSSLDTQFADDTAASGCLKSLNELPIDNFPCKQSYFELDWWQ